MAPADAGHGCMDVRRKLALFPSAPAPAAGRALNRSRACGSPVSTVKEFPAAEATPVVTHAIEATADADAGVGRQCTCPRRDP